MHHSLNQKVSTAAMISARGKDTPGGVVFVAKGDIHMRMRNACSEKKKKKKISAMSMNKLGDISS